MQVIKAENVVKKVASATESLTILSSINLNIERGSSTAVIGTSGSGKSTLLALLAGLDVPSDGRIWLAGQEITAMNEDGRARLRAEKVGFIFQSFQLLQSLNALENVMLPLELRNDDQAQAKAVEYLQRVGLGQRLHHYPKQLSGGEQQRVAIARAFANEPQILFADEPTGNLDSVTGANIIDLLFALNRENNTTLVIVTHENRLAQLCQEQLQLESGVLIDAIPRHQPVEA